MVGPVGSRPRGGTLSYDTRVQRFTLDINPATGAISNFKIAETVTFTNNGTPFNGMAPNPTNATLLLYSARWAR